MMTDGIQSCVRHFRTPSNVKKVSMHSDSKGINMNYRIEEGIIIEEPEEEKQEVEFDFDPSDFLDEDLFTKENVKYVCSQIEAKEVKIKNEGWTLEIDGIKIEKEGNVSIGMFYFEIIHNEKTEKWAKFENAVNRCSELLKSKPETVSVYTD